MELDSLKEALASKIHPSAHPDGKTKLASVLVLIYGYEPKVLMTEKSHHLNRHGGEISFPGGQWSTTDTDLLETAIRETKEEIGLPIVREEVIGQLENVKTQNSGFTITPFVSIRNNITSLKANPEVETILHIPLFPFLKTLADDTDPNHKSIHGMYTFTYEDKLIWGASARILKQIVNRINY